MNTWVSWSDSSPPKSVLPPAGEFLLIDPDDFSQDFDTFKEVNGPLSDEDGIQKFIRTAIISGNYLRKGMAKARKRKT